MNWRDMRCPAPTRPSSADRVRRSVSLRKEEVSFEVQRRGWAREKKRTLRRTTDTGPLRGWLARSRCFAKLVVVRFANPTRLDARARTRHRHRQHKRVDRDPERLPHVTHLAVVEFVPVVRDVVGVGGENVDDDVWGAESND